MSDTLKIDDPEGATEEEVSVPFGSHKPALAAAVFLLIVLVHIIYKDWESPQRSFSVPRHFLVCYPFEENLLKTWSFPPVVDPPVSRLNKATMILVKGSSSFKDPTDR